MEAHRDLEAIVITDAKGTIQYVNPGFERITGLSRYAVIGKNTHLLASGGEDVGFFRRLSDSIVRSCGKSGIYDSPGKDGAKWKEELSITAVFDASNSLVNYIAVLSGIGKAA